MSVSKPASKGATLSLCHCEEGQGPDAAIQPNDSATLGTFSTAPVRSRLDYHALTGSQ
ncbi:hypothetical protein N9D63_07895 [Opitutales bacterium]|nr:hypothetical protein [Opitutales bacterium]